MPSPFLIVTCRVGAERWLKDDVARRRPDLRSAYSRPGLVTFKATEAPLDAASSTGSPFARCWGLALGAPIRDPELAGRLQALDAVVAGLPAGHCYLHVWAREVREPEVDGTPDTVETDVDGLRAALLARYAGRVHTAAEVAEPAGIGALVLSVIVVEPDTWMVALHRHAVGRWRVAGGRPHVPVRPDAPSRVYRKIQEAIAWSGAPLKPAQTVLDIGCAPGGGTLMLLERGLHVVGIDPGAMDPSLAAWGAQFRHLQLPFQDVTPAQIGTPVDWIVYDVNLNPLQMLGPLVRLARGLPTLRGFLITLKLNTDDSPARIPAMLDRLRSIGLRELRVTQLPANRREVLAYGLTRRG